MIVVSQFAGASVWFAGNAVLGDLREQWALPPEALGWITSAVQFGFIAGTLVFAFFAVADLRSPRLVFFACTLAAAGANAALLALAGGLGSLLGLRFATGFFLAGIYPVGMKIAAGWYQRDLGKALGLLVGALVLGTAFPHLVKGFGAALPWQAVIATCSVLAVVGGVLMLAFVPDGPYLARAPRFDPRALARIFRARRFRASAFGYFGHMWELYALWAFVPPLLAAHARLRGIDLDVPLWSFAVIAAGFLGCAAGGFVSLRTGSARVAFSQLAASGACCALAPLLFHAPSGLFLAFLIFWGVVVVGDSPQFSTLNALHAPREMVGSALTIANCIGFGITIGSIELVNFAGAFLAPQWWFLLLAPGPILGLIAMAPLLRS